MIALPLTLGDLLRFPSAYFMTDLIKQPLEKRCDLRTVVVSSLQMQ
jgi:hypothetical protein